MILIHPSHFYAGSWRAETPQPHSPFHQTAHLWHSCTWNSVETQTRPRSDLGLVSGATFHPVTSDSAQIITPLTSRVCPGRLFTELIRRGKSSLIVGTRTAPDHVSLCPFLLRLFCGLDRAEGRNRIDWNLKTNTRKRLWNFPSLCSPECELTGEVVGCFCVRWHWGRVGWSSTVQCFS